jgi:outer membrane protein assembly factor BamA
MSFGVDEGGNLTSLFSTIGGPRPEEGYTLFGERYSQFVRVRPEVRWYQAVGTHGSQVVGRVLASVAAPYGNSSTVPYVKQFFSGGTNSIRAFRARSVGPGTYRPSDDSNLLIDQVGDIKFEANIEFRWTISGFVKAAVFADAGNVWLINDDPQRPGGKFNFNTAVDELAFGGGAGIRFDPEVIVVRLDLATPLRRPDLPQGDRWVFNDQFARLSDNFIFNIAIGYPF